jgi:hypothetical protein
MWRPSTKTAAPGDPPRPAPPAPRVGRAGQRRRPLPGQHLDPNPLSRVLAAAPRRPLSPRPSPAAPSRCSSCGWWPGSPSLRSQKVLLSFEARPPRRYHRGPRRRATPCSTRSELPTRTIRRPAGPTTRGRRSGRSRARVLRALGPAAHRGTPAGYQPRARVKGALSHSASNKGRAGGVFNNPGKWRAYVLRCWRSISRVVGQMNVGLRPGRDPGAQHGGG